MKDRRSFLKSLRDDWKDEIPEEIIHSTSPNNKFKVRGNWFQGVVATVGNMVLYGEITNPKLIGEIELFVERFTTKKFWGERTTTEEIEAGNTLINNILASREE